MFWTERPLILFDLSEGIFPLATQSLDLQLNSLLRLSVIIGFVGLVLSASASWLWIPLLTALVTIVLWESYQTKFPTDETIANLIGGSGDLSTILRGVAWNADNKLCMRPTPDNPMMNFTPDQYTTAPNRPPGCPLTHPGINEAQLTYTSLSMGDEHGTHDPDVLQENNRYLNLQFHTMPSTSTPNDRANFANWLYRSPDGVFKDGDMQAAPVINLGRSNLDLADLWAARGAPTPQAVIFV